MQRFSRYMGWTPEMLVEPYTDPYFPAVTMTAYNALTVLEVEAVRRLLASLQATSLGKRLDQVMWAASGSEAVQKALWACLHRDKTRDLILASRYGFHGKKGLAGAVTGSETDADRDPRVKFFAFPREERDDFSKYSTPFDFAPYIADLDRLWAEFGNRINCLITEPYLGGGGSFHPPHEYLQQVVNWCRAHDVLFILDEVQANFGRTGRMYAFETYGVEPDFVCLGKGLGNGVPVSAAVGRADIMASLKYGEGSDTWSANPLGCAAVLATLDEFESQDILGHAAKLSELFTRRLCDMKKTGLISKVRGEGMVFGLEAAPVGKLTPQETAVEIVKASYLGEPGGDGIHFLGALAGKVLRVSPPMTMTMQEAEDSLNLLERVLTNLRDQLIN
jgi:4-aminobutyrate aminotransferase-like enzyme